MIMCTHHNLIICVGDYHSIFLAAFSFEDIHQGAVWQCSELQVRADVPPRLRNLKTCRGKAKSLGYMLENAI